MKPFTLQNRDGLANQYTDEWYEYQPVRHCSRDDTTCDSPFYWCDKKLWRCRSRVVYGGNCTGFEGSQICYNSVCSQGKCVVPPRIRTATKSRIEEENELTATEMFAKERVWAKTVLLDEDGKGIEDELARVIITDMDTNQTLTVFQSGDSLFPEIPGTVYLSVPKPRAGKLSRVSMEARDQFGRYCQAQCMNTTSERYQVCQPNLNISLNSDTSAPVSFTHSMHSRRFLDNDLSVHPRQIHPDMPAIVFVCSRKLVTSVMIKNAAENVRAPVSTENYVFFRVAVYRENNVNYQIEVAPQSDIGPPFSSSIEKAASSFDPNIVFVQAPNPELHHAGVRVQVSILSNGNRVNCQIKCTEKDGSMHDCSGDVDLHLDPTLSKEDVFTSDPHSLPVLGWNMRGHPSLWRHKMPFLSFHC
uniref:Uncharacterized protein n=1 Tax=Caenorhabditis japonica TaxID=281687 RepID=A0A8R1HSY3_CAEJA